MVPADVALTTLGMGKGPVLPEDNEDAEDAIGLIVSVVFVLIPWCALVFPTL